jgi:hypothetical protein
MRQRKLSARLYSALAGELANRGINTPDQPHRPEPVCPRCPEASITYHWQHDDAGHRHVRATCGGCDRFLCFVPSAPPYSDLADAQQKEAVCS